MNARDDQAGAADQEMFETVIRDNLSPEGVAAVIAFLRPASMGRPASDAQCRALREVEWLADALTELIGDREYGRLLDELSL